jgi:hypothetical protein
MRDLPPPSPNWSPLKACLILGSACLLFWVAVIALGEWALS